MCDFNPFFVEMEEQMEEAEKLCQEQEQPRKGWQLTSNDEHHRERRYL